MRKALRKPRAVRRLFELEGGSIHVDGIDTRAVGLPRLRSSFGVIPQSPARKRHFLSHLYIKCIILPRQARDKHRESTQKSAVFSQVLFSGTVRTR
eukprot:COSAG06_NODE_1523_length_9173_cov_31.694682_3_plen_96_part_00